MYRLKDFGSFYIGGKTISIENQPIKNIKRNKDMEVTVDPNGTYTIESIYVQYFLPENYKSIYVLIHGGGHTGAIWENTPDGRKGWLRLLLEKQIGVYIIDSVERGRSGWCSIPGIWEGEPELITHETAWIAFRFGERNGIPHQNLQFPVESFSTFVKYNVPRWNCNATASAIALSQLIKKIGECTLIAHSQGADIAMQSFNLQPELIKSIILLEPAAFPLLNPESCFSHKKILTLFGDYVQLNPLWTLMKQKAVAYHNSLLQLGMDSKFISLPKIGIYGNSHMSMVEKNNADILQLVNAYINQLN